MRAPYVIYDKKEKMLIAEIDKTSKWPNLFSKAIAEGAGDEYGLVIHEPEIDRRLMVAFCYVGLDMLNPSI